MGNTAYQRMNRRSIFRLTLEKFERDYLKRELERHAWNRTATARDLEISYRTLFNKINRFHLNPPAVRFPESA